MMDFKDVAELALAIMLPLGGGFAGGILTGNQIKTWYAKLKKPTWNPPNWLFGPVWTVLYICMGVASWLVYKQGGFEQQAVPLTLYGVQLVLNLAWTPIFFGLHRLGLALLDILVLDGLVIATIVHFARVIGVGAALGLLLPYLLWSSFATLLTYTIWRLNAKHVRAGGGPGPAAARKRNE